MALLLLVLLEVSLGLFEILRYLHEPLLEILNFPVLLVLDLVNRENFPPVNTIELNVQLLGLIFLGIQLLLEFMKIGLQKTLSLCLGLHS